MQIESFFQIKTSVANPQYMTNALEQKERKKEEKNDRQGDRVFICTSVEQ